MSFEHFSIYLYIILTYLFIVDGEKRDEDKSSQKTPHNIFKRETNHSMFVSETGTGLMVSFIPNNADQ